MLSHLVSVGKKGLIWCIWEIRDSHAADALAGRERCTFVSPAHRSVEPTGSPTVLSELGEQQFANTARSFPMQASAALPTASGEG